MCGSTHHRGPKSAALRRDTRSPRCLALQTLTCHGMRRSKVDLSSPPKEASWGCLSLTAHLGSRCYRPDRLNSQRSSRSGTVNWNGSARGNRKSPEPGPAATRGVSVLDLKLLADNVTAVDR